MKFNQKTGLYKPMSAKQRQLMREHAKCEKQMRDKTLPVPVRRAYAFEYRRRNLDLEHSAIRQQQRCAARAVKALVDVGRFSDALRLAKEHSLETASHLAGLAVRTRALIAEMDAYAIILDAEKSALAAKLAK